jgi:hypothetical protein
LNCHRLELHIISLQKLFQHMECIGFPRCASLGFRFEAHYIFSTSTGRIKAIEAKTSTDIENVLVLEVDSPEKRIHMKLEIASARIQSMLDYRIQVQIDGRFSSHNHNYFIINKETYGTRLNTNMNILYVPK